jgi:hypothetical protein
LHATGFLYTLRTGAGVVAATGSHHLGAKEGAIMEFLVVAIVAIVGVGLFRFWRIRSAH